MVRAQGIAVPKTTGKVRRPPVRLDEATVTPSTGNVFADLGFAMLMSCSPRPTLRTRFNSSSRLRAYRSAPPLAASGSRSPISRTCTGGGSKAFRLSGSARCSPRSGYLFGPITEQRYTSSVGASVISPAAAASATSLSENSCRGAWPALNEICTSRHSGLKPSP